MIEIRKNAQLIVDSKLGDCFRACVSSILCVPNDDRLPNAHDAGWILKWEEILEPLGIRLRYDQKSIWKDGYWIASVRSKNFEGVTHAIVMKGLEIFHDPTTTENKYMPGMNLLGEKMENGDSVVVGGYHIEVEDASKLPAFVRWQEEMNKPPKPRVGIEH